MATVVAVIVLWPPKTRPPTKSGVGTPVALIDATVSAASVVPCGHPVPGMRLACREVTARLDGGPEKDQTTTLELSQSPDEPLLRKGDKIILGRSAERTGVMYYFSDYQRRRPLIALGLLFAIAVVGLARWRGAAAIAGLGVSLLVLIRFVLPAILAGENAMAVAIAGSAVIVLFVVYLAHGVSARTTTALIGTLFSLALTAALALVFVRISHLTGLSSEEGTYLRGVVGAQVNLQGLLLGGVVIGSLGVLNDITVTQASAVWELYLANPETDLHRLYGSAMRIGRDHIASTVYTLVLAYAGAALPLLVLFTVAGRRLGDVLTGEIVAEEIVRTLVGSVGLVAAVPITTALACLLVTRTVARKRPDATGIRTQPVPLVDPSRD